VCTLRTKNLKMRTLTRFAQVFLGGGLETWWPRLCLDTPGKTITLDELDRIPELVSIIVNH